MTKPPPGEALLFQQLKTILVRTRGRTRFDRAAADRILDDLRHAAYQRGREAVKVFQAIGDDVIDADEELAWAKDDLDHMTRNLPFLREVAAHLEEIESMRDELCEQARLFFGWRPYSGRWTAPNPVWAELKEAFREGRDDEWESKAVTTRSFEIC